MKEQNDNQFKRERIAFLKGSIEGITLYAVWRDGKRLVGCMETPLKNVIQPYEEEITRLEKELQ